MNPRKVLIFSLSYYPRLVGGAEVAVKEITDRIMGNEIDFSMITIGDGRGIAEEKIGNVKVYRISHGAGLVQKLFFPFKAYKKAASLHKAEKFDAVWSIMASYAGYAGYLFKKKNLQVPFILTIQEGDNFGRRSLLKALFRKIFAKADKIQAISNFLAEWSHTMGARCLIEVVPNAVDFGLFASKISDEEAERLKSSVGKKANEVLLITTSRLVKKNGVGDIIEALGFLPANFKLLVLGSGPLESRLKSQCSSRGLHDRVIFLGYVPHSEMPKYLQISDIFIRPSLSEGLGNSFLEAMAAGVPVIGTPVGGILDFLKNGETGLFCEVENPKSIVLKIEKLMKDKASKEYIVKQARDMVSNKYRWESVAIKMKDILVG